MVSVSFEHEITIKHIHTIAEFTALQQPWSALFDSCNPKTAFLSWEWQFAWWKNYGIGKDLWLLTAWKADTLIGIAPLMLSKNKQFGLRYRILQSLGKPNTDEGGFLAAENREEVIRLFFKYIQSQKKHWDAIELCELNSEAVTTPILLMEIPNLKLVMTQSLNPHFHIQTSGNWDTYWGSLSKNTRESVEKRLKQGRKKFNLEFKYLKGADVNWQNFETIFAINRKARFSEKYGTKQEQNFTRDLVEIMHQRGWLEIIFLYMDGQPVAYDYGFNISGKFEDWRTGYNQEYTTQAVGKLLLYLLIQYQFENEYHDFDFLRGAYEYKVQWNPESRDFINLTAVKPLHLPARLALITLPRLWEWTKRNILKRAPN